ncbi:MSP domain protein VAP [Aphelenchoides avenae]|nr:MSP domain protein VAP [Aphelenchus avenae]
MDSKLKVLFVHPSGEDGAARSPTAATAASPPNAATPAPREHRDMSNISDYSAAAQTAHSPSQQASLVREVENRKRVEDDKANLERENRELRMRLAKLESNQLQAQMPTWYFALIALAGLLIGLIFGKLF